MNSLPIRIVHAVVLGALLAALGGLVYEGITRRQPRVVYNEHEARLEDTVERTDRATTVVDMDEDGMPDAWEMANYLNPNEAADAGSDFDRDGITALQEYQNGTKPNGNWKTETRLASSSLTRVSAINLRGDILLAEDSDAVKAYFLGQDDVLTRIYATGRVNDQIVYALDMNGSGQVVGQTILSWQQLYTAAGFIWDKQSGGVLTVSEGVPAFPVSINNHGEWVGGAGGFEDDGPWNGWLSWNLSEIKDSGLVMGTYYDGVDYRTFIGQDGWFYEQEFPADFPFEEPVTNATFLPSHLNDRGEFTWSVRSGDDIFFGACYVFDGEYRKVKVNGSSGNTSINGYSNHGFAAAWDDMLGGFLWRGGVGVPIGAIFPGASPWPGLAINEKDEIAVLTAAGGVVVIKPDQDQDQDGMSDDWELVHGLNRDSPSDALADPDGDGINNLGEYLLGSNPNAAPPIGPGGEEIDIRPGIDTDGDGMPNVWEWENGLSYDDASDAAKDLDGDGYTNLQEYRLNTNPNGPPVYRVHEIGPFSGFGSLTWTNLKLAENDDAFLEGIKTGMGGRQKIAWRPSEGAAGAPLIYPPAVGAAISPPVASSDSGAVAATFGFPKKFAFWPTPTSLPISYPLTGTSQVSGCSLSPNGTWLTGWQTLESSGALVAFVWKMPAVGETTFPVSLATPVGASIPSNAKLSVNDYGFVVGTVTESGANRAALWTPVTGSAHSPQLLANLAGGSYAGVIGLSNTAAVTVGGNGDRAGGYTRAIAWNAAGVATDLGSAGGSNSTASVISYDGQIAGSSPVVVNGATLKQLFLARPGAGGYALIAQGAPSAALNIYSINSGGEILGDRGSYLVPALWRGGKMFPLESAIPEMSGYSLKIIRSMNGRGSLLAYGYRGTEAVYQILTTDVDTDGDGMLDAAENSAGLKAFNASDGTADPDNDGLPNVRELLIGTNPFKADTDGDLLPDKWEIDWGLDPKDPTDAGGDTDGDKVSNLREYQLGTDPVATYSLTYQSIYDPADIYASSATVLGASDGTLLVSDSYTYFGDGWGSGVGGSGNFNHLKPMFSGAWLNIPSTEKMWNVDSSGVGTGDEFEVVARPDSDGTAHGIRRAFIRTYPSWTLERQEGKLFNVDSAGALSWINFSDLEEALGIGSPPPGYPNTLSSWSATSSPQGRSHVIGEYEGNVLRVFDEKGKLRSQYEGTFSPTLTAVSDSGHVVTFTESGVEFWDGQTKSTFALPPGRDIASMKIRCEGLTNDDLLIVGQISDTGYLLVDCKNGNYTQIRAPFSGYTTTSSVSEGANVIGGGEKGWMILNGTPLLLDGLRVTGSGVPTGSKVGSLGWSYVKPVRLTENGQILLMLNNADNEVAYARLLPILDTDNDGVPDDWERSVIHQLLAAGVTVSTDITQFDPNKDYDGDGATSIDEWRAGTSDGTKAAGIGVGITNRANKDRDGDGLLNKEDADPDDRVIDWTKGADPIFVIQPIGVAVSEGGPLDIDADGTALFGRADGPGRLIADGEGQPHTVPVKEWKVGIYNHTFWPSGNDSWSGLIGRAVEGGHLYDVPNTTKMEWVLWNFDDGEMDINNFIHGDFNGIGAGFARPTTDLPFDFKLRTTSGQDLGVIPGASAGVLWTGIGVRIDSGLNIVSGFYNGDPSYGLCYWERDPVTNGYFGIRDLSGFSGEYIPKSEVSTATVKRTGDTGEDILRHLIPLPNGMLVAKSRHSFLQSSVGKGLFPLDQHGMRSSKLRGVTSQGWLIAKDSNESTGAEYLWANGKWRPIGDYVVNSDAYQVQEICYVDDSGMMLAKVSSGTTSSIYARIIPIGVDAESNSAGHSPLEAANPPYMREVRINGIQKSDGKPQEGAELDIPGEETSVDAYGRNLRHNTSIAYVDVPASEMDLAVKLSVDNQPISIPSFEAINVHPVNTVDWRKKVAKAVEESAAMEIGCFGLGWRSNLEGGVVCNPVFDEASPKTPAELVTGRSRVNFYNVEVTDENGTKYSFSSQDLVHFTFKVQRVTESDQFLISLQTIPGGLRLRKKYGTTTDFAWTAAPPAIIDNQHTQVTAGTWFLPKPYRAKIISAEDLGGASNRIVFENFGQRDVPSEPAVRTIKVNNRDAALKLTIQMAAMSGPGSSTRFDLVKSVTNPRGVTVRLEYDWISCAGGQLPVLARIIQPDGSTVHYDYSSRFSEGSGSSAPNADIWATGTGANSPITDPGVPLPLIQQLLLKPEEDEEENDRDTSSYFHVNLSAVQTHGGKITRFEWEPDVRYESTMVWQKATATIDSSYSNYIKGYLNGFKRDAEEHQKKKTWLKIDKQQLKRGAIKVGEGVYLHKTRGLADVVKGVKVEAIDGTPGVEFSITQTRPEPTIYQESPGVPLGTGGGTAFLQASPDAPSASSYGSVSGSAAVTQVTDAEGRQTSYRFSAFHTLQLPIEPPLPGTSPQETMANGLRRTIGVGYTKMEFFHDPTHKVTYEFDPKANYALKKTTDLHGNTTEYEHGDLLGSTILAANPQLTLSHAGSHPTPVTLFTHYEDPTAEIRKSSDGLKEYRKEFKYDPATRKMTSVVDARGNETFYEVHPTTGRTVEERSYQGRQATGTLVSKKKYAYTSSSFPMFVTREEISALPSSGDPAWVTSLVTTHEADANGRLKKTIVDPGGLNLVTETTYDGGGNVLTKKDPRNHTSGFDYDLVGRLIEVTNPDATRRTIGYDKDGRKIRETDELGRSALFKYDGLGRLIQSGRDMNGNHRIDAGDLIVSNTYNQLGQTLTTTDARGNVSVNGYDVWHRLTSTTDALGNTTGFDYSGANSGTGLANDPKWLPTRVVNPLGYLTETGYDAFYRPTKVRKEYQLPSGGGLWTTRALGLSLDVETDYDANGNAIESRTWRSSSASAMRSTTDYDALGRAFLAKTGVGTALNSATRTLHTSTGLAYETVAFDGHPTLEKHTQTTYDAAGRPILVTAPDPATGLISSDSATAGTGYDDASNVVYSDDVYGNRTNFEYDVRNRKIKSLAPAAADALNGGASVRAQSLTSYDLAGNVETVTDHYGTVSRTYYDPANRAWKTVMAEGRAEEATTESGFDANGNVITAKDANGNLTRNFYDKLNRLIATAVDPTGGNPSASLASPGPEDIVVANGYDAVGNLVGVIDGAGTKTWNTNNWSVSAANGHFTRFTYDGLGRKTSTTWDYGSSLAKVDTSQYDALYQISKQDALGQITEYEYDDLGRVTTVTPLVRLQDVLRYAYAGEDEGSGPGPLEAALFTEGGSYLAGYYATPTVRDVNYGFDRLDRTVAETSADVTHHYEFDKAGNRVLVTYGGTSRKIVSKYDSNNRLTRAIETTAAVSDPRTYTAQVGDRVTAYHYDALGRAVRVEMPNGTFTTRSHDRLGRTLQLKTRDSSSMVQSSYNYTDGYDAMGNVLSFQESTSTLAARTVTNIYDHTYRLTSEAATTGVNDLTTEYAYDKACNRTLKRVAANGTETSRQEYVFGKPTNGLNTNQLYGIGLNGVTDPAATGAFETIFTYDPAGNMSSRTKGTQVDSYSYDVSNRLVGMGRYLAGGYSASYEYAYDYRTRRVFREEPGTAGDAVSVFSGGLSVQEYAPPTMSVDPPLVETIRGSDMGGGVGGVLYSLRGGLPSYNAYNSRGDVISQSNAGGGVEWQASYQAFGTRTTESGTNLDRQRANTKDEDPTGLLNEGMRYRDLESGVFLTRDPAGFVDGPNVYAYVKQNPWTSFDPDGLRTGGGVPDRADEADSDRKEISRLDKEVGEARSNLAKLGKKTPRNRAEAYSFAKTRGELTRSIKENSAKASFLEAGLEVYAQVNLGGYIMGPRARREADRQFMASDWFRAMYRDEGGPPDPGIRDASADIFNIAMLFYNPTSIGMFSGAAKTPLTNSQLVQSVATRADAWGARQGLGLGPRAGTLKHSYADDLLTRYQSRFGDRGLSTEVPYLNGQAGVGGRGSIRLDVVEGTLDNPAAIFDYKFGGAALTPQRIQQIRQVGQFGPNVPITGVHP